MRAMSQERFSIVNDIIRGIARRSAYKFKTKDDDELSQELWLYILTKQEEVDHDLDLNMIAKMCYDKIVDIIRYDSRRNTYSLDVMIDHYESDTNTTTNIRITETLGSLSNDDEGILSKSPEDAIVDNDQIKRLFELFPKGSKERLFLEYWGSAAEIGDFGITPRGTYKNGYSEKELAVLLGYASSASGGYKTFRRKMRERIKEFFSDD